MDLSLDFREIKLRVPWKLSRNTSLVKHNGFLTATVGETQFHSEIAPNIRYGESPEKVKEEFLRFQELLKDHSYLESLDLYPFSSSLRLGLELLWIQNQAFLQNKNLSTYLHVPSPQIVDTSFSLPILDQSEIASYIKDHQQYSSLKVKINAERAWEIVEEVSRCTSVPLRIDGNEAFTDISMYKDFEYKLINQKINVDFIEEPFPASRVDLYKKIYQDSPFIIIADESILNHDNLEELSGYFHGVNIKLMKTGSILKARDFLMKSKTLGLKTMIGCMIETSLGISFAMQLNALADYIDLDGFLLIENDPFNLVTEKEGKIKLVN